MAHSAIRIAFLIAIVLFMLVLLYQWRSRAEKSVITSTLLIGLVTSSIFVPRLTLLAGIDAFMYPGILPRYLAAAEFQVWFFSTTVIALAVRYAFLNFPRYDGKRRIPVTSPTLLDDGIRG